MKNLKIILILLLSLVLGCSSDSEEDLAVNNPVVSEVTYDTHIRPIMNNNCISCHSNPPINGASVPLTNYNSVRGAVLNNQLIARIKSQQPGFRMPLGGPSLPQNLIDLVEKWNEDGLLEK